jgi:hypothetical protein
MTNDESDLPTDALTTSSSTSSTTSAAESAPADRRRGRRRLGRALLVIGAVLAPITMTSLFVRNIVLDTDRYVETVSPLGSDPAIRAAAVSRITDTIMGAIDVQSIVAQRLPGPLGVIATPVETAIRTTVSDTADEVLASDKFASLWDAANRVAHANIRSLLTESRVIELPNGRLVIDLTAVVAEVRAVLVDRGLDFFAPIPITQLTAGLELFDAEQLQEAQTAVRIMRTAVWVLVVLTLACFVAAIALAADRRKAVAHVGAALAIGAAVLVTAVNIGRQVSLGSLPDGVDPDAAAAAFDILTRFFRQSLRTVFGLGLVLVVAAWMAGPGGLPARLRRTVRSRGLTDAADEPTATSIWVRDHATALRVALLAVIGAVAVSVERPSMATVLIGALAVAAGLGAISMTAAPASATAAPAD